jgi:hypothetical protein
VVLSERVRQIQPSPTLALTARAQQLRQQGIDVLAFTAGEPDLDTPTSPKRVVWRRFMPATPNTLPRRALRPCVKPSARSSTETTSSIMHLNRWWSPVVRSTRCSAR